MVARLAVARDVRRGPLGDVCRRGARLRHPGAGVHAGERRSRGAAPRRRTVGLAAPGHRRAARRHPGGQPGRTARGRRSIRRVRHGAGRLLRPASRCVADPGGVHRFSAGRRQRVVAQPVSHVHLDAGHPRPALLRPRPARPGGQLPSAPAAVRPGVAGPGPEHRRRGRLRRRCRPAVRRGRGGVIRVVRQADRAVLVRRAVAGVGGGRRHRRCLLHPPQPPDPARAGHRRAVPADDRARHRDDRRHPGAAGHPRAGGVVAADLFSRAGRTPPVPRRRRPHHRGDGTGALRRGGGPRRGADPAGPQPLRRRDGRRRPGRGVGQLLSRHRRADGGPGPGLLPRRRPVGTDRLRGLPARLGGGHLPVQPGRGNPLCRPSRPCRRRLRLRPGLAGRGARPRDPRPLPAVRGACPGGPR